MNVFVLCTGRCGSLTFAKACERITNFSSGHESQSDYARSTNARPYESLTYPDKHIEVDNRLSWFLGGLDKEYGKAAYYVHLLRKREDVAKSFVRRWHKGIMFAFTSGILTYSTRASDLSEVERYDVACRYWKVVNDNIESFLRDKPGQITMWIHDVDESFRQFWDDIAADGDFDAALRDLKTKYHAQVS